MRLLQEDALPVAREIESGYVGDEHFRRATGERRAEQRATPRPSRAARLVVERRAVGRERPAVDPSGTARSSGWLASRRNATAPSRAIRPRARPDVSLRPGGGCVQATQRRTRTHFTRAGRRTPRA